MAAAVSDHELVAYAAGEVDAAGASRVEAHLAGHPEARATVECYRAAVKALRADGLPATPEHVMARARAIFQAQGRSTTRWAAWMEQAGALLARLVFDSRAQPLLVRAGGDERFQAVWESEAAEVEIEASLADVARSPGGARRWRVLGQVTAASNGSAIAVALTHPGTRSPVAEAAADEAGRFRIEAPAARYELLVRVGDSPVLAARLDLE